MFSLKTFFTHALLVALSFVGAYTFTQSIQKEIASLQASHYERESKQLIESFLHLENSKQTYLSKINTTALILMSKNPNKIIAQAMPNHALEDYHLTSFNEDSQKIELIKQKGLNYFLKIPHYRIYQNHLIVPYKITQNNQDLGYYLLIKAIEPYNKNSIYLLGFGVFGVLFLVLFFSTQFYQKKQEITIQREHFKEIINSTIDIIMIFDHDRLIDANLAFYKFFEDCKTLEDFEKSHNTIANLFVQEEGFIQKTIGGYHWVEYAYHHKTKEHQLKIDYKQQEHIFALKVQALSQSGSKIYTHQELYTVVLSDITTMKRYQEELERITKTDILTKLGNRESFYQNIHMEIARAKRHATELSLIMFDIDRFNKINELYGQEAGDSVLIKIAQSVKDFLRTTDVLCRYSGDAFMIILPKVQSSGALILAQRIVEHIKCLDVAPVDGVTISAGVTQYRTSDTLDTLLMRTTQALNEAKSKGGNGIELI